MAGRAEQIQPQDRQTLRPGLVAMCFGLLVFLSVLLIAGLFDRQQVRMHKLSAEKSTAEIGVQLADTIENEISKRLATIQALAAFKKINGDFTQREFEDFANEIEDGDSAIISLQFAPDGVVEYVTQPERNAKAIGHDLLGDPARSQFAYRSIETGDLLIAGPIDLIQGGLALIARKPLYDEDQWDQKEFWGFATIVLEFSAVTDLLAREDDQRQYRHALSNGSCGDTKEGAFWGDPDIFNKTPHCAGIQLVTGTWALSTIPMAGWPTAWNYATGFRIACLAVGMLMAALTVILLNKPALLRLAVDDATADLRETELRLRDANRLAKIGSWTLCGKGKFVFSEEALELLRLESSSSGSRVDAFYTAIHPDDREHVRNEIENAMENSGTAESTFRVNWDDGKVRTLRMIAEGTTCRDQPALRGRGTIQDITEDIESEQQLRRAQKMEAVGQLTGGVAHDFNNLLTVVQNNAELLELTQSYDKELVSEIQKATHRGASLTHQLLAYARKQPLSPKVTDLSVLVQGMERILTRSLGENINIVLKFPPNLWSVKVDSGQLEDAILNLALNARDAMKRGGRLLIKCENMTHDTQQSLHDTELEAGKYVVLSVTDSGSGMDENIKTRAFEPFFTSKTAGEASGLGLSMVSGLARQSGGGVSIESQVGLGTKVKLYLPFEEREQKTAINAQQSHDVPYGSGEVILVVEDNSVVARVVSRLLAELGYKTIEASNAINAQMLLQAHGNIDLVLTDVILPGGMSGIDLASAVTTGVSAPAVVVMSGYPRVANGTTPDNDFSEHQILKKPFTREALAHALRDKLETHAYSVKQRTH